MLVLLGVALALAEAGLEALKPPFIVSLEHLAYDTLLNSRVRPETSGKVIIVDLDEKSLDLIGQWPWPRYRIATLLERIQAMGPASVGLDMVFAEPDRSSPSQLEQQLLREFKIKTEIRGLPERLRDHDTLLAQRLAHGPYVLGYKFLFDEAERSTADCLLHPLRWRPSSGTDEKRLHQARAWSATSGGLLQAAGTSGFFNATRR
jgi:adenylate cyclase